MRCGKPQDLRHFVSRRDDRNVASPILSLVRHAIASCELAVDGFDSGDGDAAFEENRDAVPVAREKVEQFSERARV